MQHAFSFMEIIADWKSLLKELSTTNVDETALVTLEMPFTKLSFFNINRHAYLL